MSKRTEFTYEINYNKSTKVIEDIEEHLKQKGFIPIKSNNERVFLSYPTEINFKVKGELPECITVNVKDSILTMVAWLYLDTYNEHIANLSPNEAFSLDPSKEIGLDGNMIIINKTNLRNKILEIEKLFK